MLRVCFGNPETVDETSVADTPGYTTRCCFSPWCCEHSRKPIANALFPRESASAPWNLSQYFLKRPVSDTPENCYWVLRWSCEWSEDSKMACGSRNSERESSRQTLQVMKDGLRVIIWPGEIMKGVGNWLEGWPKKFIFSHSPERLCEETLKAGAGEGKKLRKHIYGLYRIRGNDSHDLLLQPSCTLENYSFTDLFLASLP